MPQSQLRTRLILDLRDAPANSDLAALLAAGDIACALLPQGTTSELAGSVHTLQDAGVAALVRDDIDLAIALDADGVHLSASPDSAENYETARKRLPKDRIIGAEIGPNRHVAMVLAEAGADYVAFQYPEQQDDLTWWSEIFEVPCVALGRLNAEDAAVLAHSGVEFISVSANTDEIRGVEDAVASIELVEA